MIPLPQSLLQKSPSSGILHPASDQFLWIDFAFPANAGRIFAEATHVVMILHGPTSGAPIEIGQVPPLFLTWVRI
jgi:hypothetical protein